MKYLKKLLSILVILVIVVGVGYILAPHFIDDKISNMVKTAQDFAETREIFSVPLIDLTQNGSSKLTNQGIIQQTNVARDQNGKLALTENKKLDQAAAAKVQDMFNLQYFEHVAPNGNGPGYLADQAGYSYLIIGENLAMGNFADDKALVDAWMASPGHRANILNDRFSEIGVAVGEGMMNGKKVWLAVQEFGAPSSECPVISATLKAKIDSDKAQSASLSAELDTLKKDLDTMSHDTQTSRDAYNAKVDQYNQLVSQYSTLTTGLHTEIDQYNAQVKAFNACLNGS